MKISNEQLQALQETEARRKPSAAQDGFESLLAQQMDTKTAQGLASTLDPQALMRGTMPVSLTGETGAAASGLLQGTAAEMTMRMDGLFNGMESYALQLASDNPTALRGAYSQLEQPNTELASFRSAFPDLEAEQPELAAMMNELEAVAVTETFKFNRGDYL